MIRAVLFDVDDTLIDYSRAERDGILAYLTELGVPADRLRAGADLWRRVQEKHFARYLAGELDFAGQQRARAAEVVTWLGRPVPTDPAELSAWFDGYRRHHQTALRAFDDVDACLAALCRRVPVGVVSNSGEAATRRKLSQAGLLDRFRCVVCVDTAGCAKPDPGIFRYACRSLTVEPVHAAYVGDRLDTDAVAAAAAGLRGVWLDRTGTPDQASWTAPDGVARITGLTDLPGVLGLAHVPAATST